MLTRYGLNLECIKVWIQSFGIQQAGLFSCTTDDLPTIEYLIAPEEASQNFLVMGRAYDSEGIRDFYWQGEVEICP